MGHDQRFSGARDEYLAWIEGFAAKRGLDRSAAERILSAARLCVADDPYGRSLSYWLEALIPGGRRDSAAIPGKHPIVGRHEASSRWRAHQHGSIPGKVTRAMTSSPGDAWRQPGAGHGPRPDGVVFRSAERADLDPDAAAKIHDARGGGAPLEPALRTELAGGGSAR